MHKMSICSAGPQICDVTFVVNVLHWETNGPQMFFEHNIKNCEQVSIGSQNV